MSKNDIVRVMGFQLGPSALTSTSSVTSQSRTGVKTNRVFSADDPTPLRLGVVSLDRSEEWETLWSVHARH